MTNYVLSFKFAYFEDTNEIYIGGTGCNQLSESDRDIFISDALTHEHIHKILSEWFGHTATSLFDTIGDDLLDYDILKVTVDDTRTWKDAIKQSGFDYFLGRKGLIQQDITDCNKLCNKRVVD